MKKTSKASQFHQESWAQECYQILDTPLCSLLGCKYPIIQTAMGWIATPQLVVAVVESGGFGFLAGATMTSADLHKAILLVKKKTKKPFGVNFHAFQHDASSIVDIIIEENVRAVSYGRSPNLKLVHRLRDAGVLCIPTVGALRHAQKAQDMGADAITVQGSEGGGHTGNVATSILLPQIIAHVKIPVIAAGGFYSGASLVAALAYGASGIAMGTRFLMTKESPIPKQSRAYYCKTPPSQIVVTRTIDGLPQRVIHNSMIKKLDTSWRITMFFRSIYWGLLFGHRQGMTLKSFITSGWKAWRSGGLINGLMAANAPALICRAIIDDDAEKGILPSGQVCGLLETTPPCATIIRDIMSSACAIIDRFQKKE